MSVPTGGSAVVQRMAHPATGISVPDRWLPHSNGLDDDRRPTTTEKLQERAAKLSGGVAVNKVGAAACALYAQDTVSGRHHAHRAGTAANLMARLFARVPLPRMRFRRYHGLFAP